MRVPGDRTPIPTARKHRASQRSHTMPAPGLDGAHRRRSSAL